MTDATASQDQTSEQSARFWARAKWVAQFLGLVGGGSGGFAVLAFGIGYLATKAHDDMLGLPTMTSSYTVYVRTGALFFPRSIHDAVLAAEAPTVGRVVLGAVLAGAILAAMLRRWSAANAFLSKKSNQPALFTVTYAAVVVLVVLYLPYHVAALRPTNTNLLFQQPVAGDSESLNAALRRDDIESLHRRYGAQCAAVLGFAYVAYALFRWRRSLGTDGETPGFLSVTDWVARPVLYTALAAFVITIPTVYGVLAVPLAPCVQPWVVAKTGDKAPTMRQHGLLWSDPTADTTHLVILERAPYGYAQQFYERDHVRRLETKKCTLLEPPTTASPP